VEGWRLVERRGVFVWIGTCISSGAREQHSMHSAVQQHCVVHPCILTFAKSATSGFEAMWVATAFIIAAIARSAVSTQGVLRSTYTVAVSGLFYGWWVGCRHEEDRWQQYALHNQAPDKAPGKA